MLVTVNEEAETRHKSSQRDQPLHFLANRTGPLLKGEKAWLGSSSQKS